MSDKKPHSSKPSQSFRQALGSQIRNLRKQHGVRQEHVALIARRWGLPWTSNTVVQLETGRRHLTVEEWLLLPTVLTQALNPNQSYTWDNLISLLATNAQIALTTETRAYLPDIEQLIRNLGVINPADEDAFDTPQNRHMQAWSEIETQQRTGNIRKGAVSPDVVTTVDIKASRTLNVLPTAIVQAAHRLWKRSLMEERDFRLIATGYEMATPRKMQALRGAMTRELLTELRPQLRRMRLRPKPAGRPGRPKKGGKS
tara:strand:- start:5501 stop:6271 length:771 start_codon:yes stop_codon:yes gene_type:complete